MRIAFGPPAKGYLLHRLSPTRAVTPGPGRTACGAIIVRGLDTFTPLEEGMAPCDECDQIVALYEQVEQQVMELQARAKARRRTLGLRETRRDEDQ